MIETISLWLQGLANTVPLELFAIIGSLTEELIAPIPSPFVNVLAGSITRAQGLGVPTLLWICFLSSITKTAATWVFYFLGDKLEDAVIPRFGKYIGVKQADLENFGKHFQGGWKDDVILFVLRSIPVMPSSPVSLICGILKINIRTFFLATLCGFFVRNLFFAWLGYTGSGVASSLLHGFESAESILTAVIILLIVVVLGWLYWKRRKSHPGTWIPGSKE